MPWPTHCRIRAPEMRCISAPSACVAGCPRKRPRSSPRQVYGPSPCSGIVAGGGAAAQADKANKASKADLRIDRLPGGLGHLQLAILDGEGEAALDKIER